MNGWFGRNVYAASSDYVGFLTLGESVTRSLVRAPRGPLSVLLEMLPTHTRAHAHTCPHTPTRIRQRTHTGSSSNQTEHSRGWLSTEPKQVYSGC